jgi:hypothetical protein
VSNFDENVDALGLAEEHAKRVLELEEAQTKQLLQVYARVAKTLRARLRQLPRDSFSAQQVRVTLLQLEAAMRAFESDLSDEAQAAAAGAAERGVRDLITEANKFNTEFRGTMQPLNIDVQLTAIDAKQRLFNNYQTSIDSYSLALRQQIATQLQDMVIARKTGEEIYTKMVDEDAIGSFFEGEAWRLRRIVRTELHGIYNGAKLLGLERVAGIDDEVRKALYHPMDNRTADDSKWVEQRQQNDEVKGRDLDLRPRVDQPFKYVWRDKKTSKRYRRIYMAPPDRPNDRSILIPYHPSWGD